MVSASEHLRSLNDTVNNDQNLFSCKISIELTGVSVCLHEFVMKKGHIDVVRKEAEK